MCVYCGFGFVANIIHEEQGEDRSPGVSVYIIDETLNVDIDAEACWEFGAPVNFCPMCGRDLRGGSDAEPE